MSKFGLLNTAAKCLSAIAIPTALDMPCPRGPVETSTPGVTKFSGCPGVLDPSCRKFLRSSMVMSQPVKCSIAYSKAHAWPLDKTKRSRLNHSLFPDENRIISPYKTWAIGAHPIGAPGCPEFAFSTMSAHRTRMLSMHLTVMELSTSILAIFFDGVVSNNSVAVLFVIWQQADAYSEFRKLLLIFNVTNWDYWIKLPTPVEPTGVRFSTLCTTRFAIFTIYSTIRTKISYNFSIPQTMDGKEYTHLPLICCTFLVHELLGRWMLTCALLR